MRRRADLPVVLVMGDVDLLRPLVMAGIPCAVFAPADDPVRWSRHAVARLPWVDHWERQEDAAKLVEGWARRQAAPPVLMPQTDGDLLTVSRNRERLAAHSRFLLADADLVETLTDKARFSALGRRLGLPVPRAAHVSPADDDVRALDLRFPLVVKPIHRQYATWAPIEAAAKARHVASRQELAALWSRLAAAQMDVLVQEAVPGAEAAIESYHAYVDAAGEVAAEFTGRKIRTLPQRYGHSTAVEITASKDVAAAGRDALARLGLRGVAKADFKRGPDGTLHLLEVNPRFTLWHHPAAVAGVNIPALVHADLTGTPRPAIGPVRPGVRWCTPVPDLLAARTSGLGVRRWLRWAARCEARSGMALDDPGPLARSVWSRVRRLTRG